MEIPWFTIAFLILAGMFKAVADTLTHHFDVSIFRKKDRKWWDPSQSWKYVKILKPTGYRPDAWHLANSGMIFSFCAALAFATDTNIAWYWLLLGAGIIFNLSFNLFYNKILV